MTPTITAFETSPDRGRGMARDMRVRWALEEVGQPYQVRLLSFSAMKEPAPLLDFSAVVQRICKELMKLAIRICRAAFGKSDRLGGFASTDKLAEFFAAEWGEWSYLIPAAHSVRWQGFT